MMGRRYTVLDQRLHGEFVNGQPRGAAEWWRVVGLLSSSRPYSDSPFSDQSQMVDEAVDRYGGPTPEKSTNWWLP
jgi:hypothetical protein